MYICGKKIASEIYNELQQKISLLEKKPTLGAILVGNNSESLRYIGQKRKFAEKTGIHFELLHLPENVSQEDLLSHIWAWNSSENISGYIVQLPLPKHIDSTRIIASILPKKDVDGFHPENQGKVMIGDESGFVPCTPAGVLHILASEGISLSGKKICIIGRSNIVWKPLALLCINAWATVTSCNSQTPYLKEFTEHADIVICATGHAGLLRADMISKDCIVIDVGFSVIDGKIHGDAATEEIHEQGNRITPVPGGVGPMTVAMLLSHTYTAHLWNKN